MSLYVYYHVKTRDPFIQIQELFLRKAIVPPTRIILAYGDFKGVRTDHISGLDTLPMTRIKEITNMVHEHGGKIDISIGGRANLFKKSRWFNRPGDLATHLTTLMEKGGFDGIDLSLRKLSDDQSARIATLIHILRYQNPSKHIMLTTHTYLEKVPFNLYALLYVTIHALDAWQPLEYNLQVNPVFHATIPMSNGIHVSDPTSSYSLQIQYNLTYYQKQWQVPANKIHPCLFAGTDQRGNRITLQNALQLVTFTQINQFHGLTLYDLSFDRGGCDGNAPMSYTMGMQHMFATQTIVHTPSPESSS